MHTTKPAYTQLGLNGFALEDSTACAMAHLQKHEDQEARARMFWLDIMAPTRAHIHHPWGCERACGSLHDHFMTQADVFASMPN